VKSKAASSGIISSYNGSNSGLLSLLAGILKPLNQRGVTAKKT